MNRKKEILIFLILIPVLLFSFMRLGEYYFSSEDVFYADEKGQYYGPSEKILKEYELEGNGKFIIGIWEGNLSAVSVEPAFGVLWKLKRDGAGGFYPCDKGVAGYLLYNGKIIGLTSNKEVSEVFCQIEYGDYENPSIQEVTMAVDQDGFFSREWEVDSTDDIFGCIEYIEGRNSKGEVVYRDGMNSEEVYYNDGVEQKLE